MQSFKLLYIAIILAAVALTGCQVAAAEGVPEGRIKIGGSTSAQPVVAILAEEFMKQNPNVEVTVRGGGSSLGVKGVGYKGFHIGMSSRPLTAQEQAEWPNLQASPIASEGVAVVVNRSLYDAGVQQMTLEQVAALWRGEVNNWTEMGGPGLPIRLYDRVSGSGTHNVFAEQVLGQEDAVAKDAIGVLESDEAVVQAVVGTLGAVAILSAGYQTNDVVGVSIVDETGQPIAPSTENIANGNYPVLQNLYLITDGSPQGWEKEFIDFAISPQGQALIDEAGFGRVVN